MKMGFTGTQHGMTTAQIEQVIWLLGRTAPDNAHHGDCIGADADFHELVRKNLPYCIITIHPPVDEIKRAFCQADIVLRSRPYLARNHDIVKDTDFILATPSGPERLRSGTWATIRQAQRTGKHGLIIFPDGTKRDM